MALGVHWEWRGFGTVSTEFMVRFARLRPHFVRHRVDDTYLWAPGLSTNIKFRTGVEGGLKIKRRLATEAPFELWSEHPTDVHKEPFSAETWEELATLVGEQGICPEAPSRFPADRRTVVSALTAAGCRIVVVRKVRESRSWQGPGGAVIVEVAEILSPERTVSIGLENLFAAGAYEDLPPPGARRDLEAACSALGVDEEAITSMNYMGAISSWLDGQSLGART